MPHLVTLNFVGERRPRADERHVSYQDIQELRQLIETGSTQEPSDGCDARISDQLVGGLALRHLAATVLVSDEAHDKFPVDGRVVVDTHRPELQEPELSAVLPDPDRKSTRLNSSHANI